ncbi:uncharacterized protein C1orf167 homolog [Ammospiza caudacuta]|uniref:uncharacterized protein C1orf167 homolog n=1 Tax=Ammospiza caudacuta TaxID=2857398 RepID=UPI00273A4211|nr:uncharacterized protein C1orf167 homolog [Ammospiza caudacuta]
MSPPLPGRAPALISHGPERLSPAICSPGDRPNRGDKLLMEPQLERALRGPRVAVAAKEVPAQTLSGVGPRGPAVLPVPLGISESSFWSLKVNEQRCFSTWKETAEQKALDRCNLAHLRAVSLRKHFQQWVGMLQVRGGDKQAVLNLFLLQWSSFLQFHQCTELPAELCLQSSFPASGRNWFVGNQFQSSVLQSPDNNSQPLTSYSEWEEDYTSDNSVRQQAEQHCLKRCFMVWSAQTQHHVKAQQHCRRVQLSRAFLSWHHWVMENKNQEAAAALKHGVYCVQMAFSLWRRRLAQKVEADRRFRCHSHQMTADALWHWHSCWQRKRALRELQQQWAWHSCQEKKRLVLHAWNYQTRKQKYAVLFWERFLLHRCLVTWAQATACHLRQREALSYFKRVREHQLLVGSFIKWRDKLWRAEQVPGGRKHKWQELSPGKACHRWRVAARGQRALRLGSVTTVKQACNYWTRAAAFSQCLRQRSTLIGVRKSRKMALSWPTKSRRGREQDSAPTGHFPSAIQRWLVIYRSQNRAERLLERPDVVGPSHAHARIQENTAGVDLEEWAKKWLGRRYLKKWHHTVVLHRCQHDRKLLCLARGWHQWREASRVVMLAQVLHQQQLMEKAWRVWRQRYLQSCVVQNLLEQEARSLLSQAFGRWWQLTAFQCKDKGSR